MKYDNRADLLIAAGESIKMQEKAGIDPCFKCRGEIVLDKNYRSYNCYPEYYEFPVGVLKGRAVFIKDKLYDKIGNLIIVEECHKKLGLKGLSWNPPKPKTLMVELLREDVEYWNSYNNRDDRYIGCPPQYTKASKAFYEACRKALGEQT